MKFSFSNGLVPRTATSLLTRKLLPYLKVLDAGSRDKKYRRPESALFLCQDKKMLSEVNRLVKKFGGKRLRFVVVVGIGGSNLGAKTINDALRGSAYPAVSRSGTEVIFADTLRPTELANFKVWFKKQKIKPEEIVINLISKSGSTLESLANAESLSQFFKTQRDFLNRLVVITDHDSKLWQWAKERGVEKISVPRSVGGRFSVLSAVGLLPLALAGFNVKALRRGAARALKSCLRPSVANPAIAFADWWFYQLERGRHVHDYFFFEPRLQTLGEWCRQLTAESLGKSEELNGEPNYLALTPTVSIGTMDLHSIGQLTLGGPKDKITTFVSVERSVADLKIGSRSLFRELSPALVDRSIFEMLSLIYVGVTKAYQKQKLPFVEARLPALDEESLGYFMQWQMISVMMIGALLNINAFDQPQVELYKQEVNKLLA